MTRPTALKAIVAVVSTVLAQLAVVMVGPTATFGAITDGQWVAIASAAVLAGGAVFGLKNGPDADPTTSTPTPRDGGYGLIEAVIGVLLIVLLVFVILRVA